MALLELSVLDGKIPPQERDLKHGGLFLQVVTPKATSEDQSRMQIQIQKVYNCLKTGKKKEQSFYIYPWELNALTDIMVEIVDQNKLNE